MKALRIANKMLDDDEASIKPLNYEKLHALAALMDGASNGIESNSDEDDLD
jgi:hypothetical protein